MMARANQHVAVMRVMIKNHLESDENGALASYIPRRVQKVLAEVDARTQERLKSRMEELQRLMVGVDDEFIHEVGVKEMVSIAYDYYNRKLNFLEVLRGIVLSSISNPAVNRDRVSHLDSCFKHFRDHCIQKYNRYLVRVYKAINRFVVEEEG